MLSPDFVFLAARNYTPESLTLLELSELERIFKELVDLEDPFSKKFYFNDKGVTFKKLVILKDNVMKEITRRDSLPIVQSDGQPERADKRGFTRERQTAAMLYIFTLLKVEGVDQTKKARFIEFVTGKNYQNIYKQVISPMTEKRISKARKADLQFIRPFFDNLGLREIVKMIDNELDKPLEKNM